MAFPHIYYSPEPKPEKAEPIRLLASDICCKYGFCDGDILTDMACDEFINMNGLDRHDVLIRLVKDYVLAALPFKVEIHDEFGTCHNPARLKCNYSDRDAIEKQLKDLNFSVTLDASDVQKTIDAMIEEGTAHE